MDAWESLGSPIVQGAVLEWPLPLAGRGGRLWLRFPAQQQPEIVSLGIADDSSVPPTRLHFKALELQTHAQVISVEIPPFIESPFLGVRFTGGIHPLDVYFLFLEMGVITPEKVRIPLVEGPAYQAPSEASYDRFRNPRTNEVFVKHSDTEWRGMLREDYKGFKSAVSSDPLAELDDADLVMAAELVPSAQQGYWTQLRIQNDSDADQDVALMVITDEGEVVKELRTIAAGAESAIVTAKKSSETGRVQVFAVAAEEVPLTLNIYYNYLIDMAPAAT